MKDAIKKLWRAISGWVDDFADRLAHSRQAYHARKSAQMSRESGIKQSQQVNRAERKRQIRQAKEHAARVKADAEADRIRQKAERELARQSQKESKKAEIRSFGRLVLVVSVILIALVAIWGLLALITKQPGESAKTMGLSLGILLIPAFVIGRSRFIKIPENHAVCLTLPGGRAKCILMNSVDKVKHMDAILSLPQEHPLRVKLEAEGFDNIVTREDHWFWGIFVIHFNLHWTSILPWGLKEVIVSRKKLNQQSKDLEGRVTISGDTEERTPFLRLFFPRVIFVSDLEIWDQVVLDLLLIVNGIRMLDLYEIFFVHQDISTQIDSQLEAAITNWMRTLTMKEVQEMDKTPGNSSPFNTYLMETGTPSSGFSSIGAIVNRSSYVIYEMNERSLKLQAELQSKQIAEAQQAGELVRANTAAQLRQIQAEAEAKAILLEARARADGQLEQGAAEALVVAELSKILAGDPNTASVLKARALVHLQTLVENSSSKDGNGVSLLIQPNN